MLLCKPRGVVTPRRRRRQTVIVWYAAWRARRASDGSTTTEGVLLLTNDATCRLRSARRGASARLHAKLRARSRADLEKLRRGIAWRTALRADRVKVLASTGSTPGSSLRCTRRNRQIHRMALAIRHPCSSSRVSFAGLGVGDLRPGEWRYPPRGPKSIIRVSQSRRREQQTERGIADRAAGRWSRAGRGGSQARPGSRSDHRARR